MGLYCDRIGIEMSEQFLKVDIAAKGSKTAPNILFNRRTWEKALTLFGNDLSEQVANDFWKFFRFQTKHNRLKLHSLSQATVEWKSSRGDKKPESPMYGKGDSDQRSYINLVEKKQLKGKQGGWRVGIDGRKKHHSGMSIKELAEMHAMGYTTKTGKRVTPRNPIASAYAKYKPMEKIKLNKVNRVQSKLMEVGWRRP